MFKPENIYQRIVSPYDCNTRAATGNELWAWDGTVRAPNRTTLTHSQARFKYAAKRWAREKIVRGST